MFYFKIEKMIFVCSSLSELISTDIAICIGFHHVKCSNSKIPKKKLADLFELQTFTFYSSAIKIIIHISQW